MGKIIKQTPAFPQKIGKFAKENPDVIKELIVKKIDLIQSVLEYKKEMKRLEIEEKALEIKKEEIRANKEIALANIMAQLEVKKMEFEERMIIKEKDHEYRMRKLEEVAMLLKEGNEFIKDMIKEDDDKLKQFLDYQIELVRVLKDM